jgi:2-hydroxy-6-oxonona-2,4-dienedioate hydrolase
VIPIVLVHGFMGGSAQWGALIDGLSKEHQIIAVDLPGFGNNAHLPAIDTIEGFADWVIVELRRLNIKRYNLLGHSMGGMIVQEMVRREPENIESLILYGTGAIGVLPGRFETIAHSKARALQDGARITARRISATWFLDNEKASGYEACATIAELSTPVAIAAGLDAMQAWTGEAHLPKITAKTIVICGDTDRTYSWSQTHLLWTSIPNANLAVIPKCSHAVHSENPELLSSILLDFLRP